MRVKKIYRCCLCLKQFKRLGSYTKHVESKYFGLSRAQFERFRQPVSPESVEVFENFILASSPLPDNRVNTHLNSYIDWRLRQEEKTLQLIQDLNKSSYYDERKVVSLKEMLEKHYNPYDQLLVRLSPLLQDKAVRTLNKHIRRLDTPRLTSVVDQLYSIVPVRWDKLFFRNKNLYLEFNERFIRVPIAIPEALSLIPHEYFVKRFARKGYCFHIDVNQRILYSDELQDLCSDLSEFTIENDYNTKFPVHQRIRYESCLPLQNNDQFLPEQKDRQKYRFISRACGRLNDSDLVYCLNEFNFIGREPALLCVFFRNSRVIFLWENLEHNRSGVIFICDLWAFEAVRAEIVRLIGSLNYSKRSQLTEFGTLNVEETSYTFYYKKLLHQDMYSLFLDNYLR